MTLDVPSTPTNSSTSRTAPVLRSTIIIEWRGKPDVVRVDNGPEYISGTLLAWANQHNITITHIQPGKPQQSAYVARYN